MIYRHTREDIEKYFNEPAMNQSSLKVILFEGIQSFLVQSNQLLQEEEKLYYKEDEEHFKIGKAVDCFLTEGEAIYLERYHFTKLEKSPKDTALSICMMVWDKISQRFPVSEIKPLSSYLREIYDAIEYHAYYNNRRKSFEEDTRYQSVFKMNAEAWWEEQKEAYGKIMLSPEQSQLVNFITGILLTHPHTAKLFEDRQDKDILFQVPIYFKWRDVWCKILVDMIIIDHGMMTIIPIDIKTFGRYITMFNRQMRKLRYDIQGSYYTHGISISFDQLEKIIGKKLTGYKLANFAFMAESTIRPGTPLIFVLDDNMMNQGKVGDGKDLMGWEQAIGIYKDWREVDFSLEEKVKKTNGVIHVGLDYEYMNDL